MPETRTVKITVEKVSSVDGRDGPQWELQAKVPWSQYAMKLWMNEDTHPNKPKPGTYHCTLAQGRLKDGKSGDKEYDYNWFLNAFNVSAPDDTEDEGPPPWEDEALASSHSPRAAPESAPKGQSRNGQRDATGVSIERQVAMKEARPATEWLLQMQPELVGAAVGVDDGAFVSLYLATLDNIYDHILARIQE